MSHHKVRKLTLAVFACCLFTHTARAQDHRPGYIITASNDSISGFVGYGTKNLARCSFKATRKSTAVQYSPSELKSYGIYGDKKFLSLVYSDENIPEQKKFVRVLAEGALSLYRYDKLFLIKKDNVVTLPVPKSVRIETEKGPMLKDDKRYVGILNLLLKDCGLTANKTAYAESDLTDLVNDFNKCKGQAPLKKNAKPIVKMNYLVFGGIVQSKMMTIDLYDGVTFNPSFTVIGGMGADVSSPRIFDKLFFSFQAWYVKTVYQAYDERISAGEIRYRDIVMEVSFIKVPVGVRYNFLGRNNTPYIKTGFSTSFLIQNSIKTLTEREVSDGDVVSVETYGGYDIKNKPLGFWIGIGYDKTIHNNLRLFAEIQYEDADGFIGTAIQSYSATDNFNFLLGIRF